VCRSSGGDRLLPFLVASNPTKYGQWYTLSSAEAMAAALFITGFGDDARAVMACFSWGDSFWQLNGRLLDVYASCADAAGVLAAQQGFMDQIQVEKDSRALEDRSRDFPTSSDSDSDSGSGSDSQSDGAGFRVHNLNARWDADEDEDESEGETHESESSGSDEGFREALARTRVGGDT
jgi:pre-rRNA-processing protein TSR3